MHIIENFTWGASIGIVLVIIGLELFLSRRKSVFWGIIPIFLIFTSLIGAGIYVQSIQDDNKEVLATYDFNGMTAEVKMIENSNQIMAYSHMSIKDGNGHLIDVEPFSIEKDKEMSRYTKVANYFYKKYHLTGESEEVKMINKDIASFKGVKINANFFFLAACILNFPLIVILVIMRRRIKQQRIAREIKKMNLEIGI